MKSAPARISPIIVVFVVLFILKLTATLSWSWWWIVTPLLVAVGVNVLVLACAGLRFALLVKKVGGAEAFKEMLAARALETRKPSVHRMAS